MLVEKLILHDGRMRSGNVDAEMIRARTNGLRLAIGQTDLGCCVTRNSHIPLQVLQRLTPMALDGAIGRVVADVSPFAVLNVEGWFQHDMFVGIGTADTP